MDTITIAPSKADADAAEAVEQHHAAMAGTLATLTDAVLRTARQGGEGFETARERLVAWSRDELVPHALAEEDTLYKVAGAQANARILVEAMLAEHEVVVALVERLAATADPVDGAATAASLKTLFEVHLAKENDQLLPLLLATPGVSLAELLGGMHELLGDAAKESQAGDGHQCGCGGHDEELPELDVRQVPHAIRHATVFGALTAVPAGGAMVLVAPHDPLPLLGQLEAREPGQFSTDYLERGPEAWRIQLTRSAR